MKKSKKLIAADIAECAVFIALMVAGAFISIPIPYVPITFQTVISVLSGLMLGWKKGVISMSIYCLMGLIGIPVFAAGGGIFYVLKPSFGYIIGFILSALVAGLIAGKSGYPFWRYIVAALAACIADYLIGTPYCMIAAVILKMENLTTLFVMSNLVFIPKDVALCIIAAVIAWRVMPAVSKLKQTDNE